jgi:hypothetical protein
LAEPSLRMRPREIVGLTVETRHLCPPAAHMDCHGGEAGEFDR